jgi:formylglycine-generating enzyme required for sulfatase activity
MKFPKNKYIILTIGLLLTIISCTKTEDKDIMDELYQGISVATLETINPTDIEFTTAVCGGNIINDGYTEITMFGVVWSTDANPTIEENDGTIKKEEVIQNFTAELTDLSPNTNYYVRAFASNSIGTAYGEEKIFTTRSYDIEMIKVEGGIFQMGSNDETNREQPVHPVTVSSFEIGKYEITQAQWEAIMGSNPSYFKGDNLPVERVNWSMAQEFITKLNQKTGENYRLPTEEEWEFAALGGNSSNGYTYSGSNSIEDVAWYAFNAAYKSHDVASKKANELGVYDMTGNVWEWLDGWYDNYDSDAVTDPDGIPNGTYRCLRGGCWDYGPDDCRVKRRRYDISGIIEKNVGLRVARSL